MSEDRIIKLAADLAESKEVADAVSLISMAKVYIDRAKELKALAEEAVLDFIERNGDFEFNGIRYYAGNTKKVTPKDKVVLIEQLFEAVGGDIEALVEFLTANPFKVGEVRRVFGDEFDNYFTTVIVPKLKEGKPVRRLITADVKYLEAGRER